MKKWDKGIRQSETKLESCSIIEERAWKLSQYSLTWTSHFPILRCLLFMIGSIASLVLVGQTPQPRIDDVVVPESIPFGDWIEIEVAVTNLGGTATDGGVTVSFPSLDRSSDKSRVEENGSDSDLSENFFVAADGDQIWHKNVFRFSADYLMAEVSDPEWTRNESSTFRLRVKPRETGDFVIQVRSAHGRDGQYVGYPTSGSRDQQGWWVNRYTVEVLEAPEPSIRSIEIPPSVVLGDWFPIEVEVENLGGVANDGGVTVSFPNLTGRNDDGLVRENGSNSELRDTYDEYERDDTIYHREGNHISARYLMIEGVDSEWRTGEKNTLRIEVKPEALGVFTVQIRSAMGQNGNYVGTPNSGPLDHQGWSVERRTVTVVEPEDPPSPEILAFDVPETVNLGDWVNVFLEVRNNGGVADDGGLTLSFPTLSDAGDASLVVDNGSSSDLNIFKASVGDRIYHKNSNQIEARYVMFEGADSDFREGDRNFLRVRVKPKTVGSFLVQSRSALGADGEYVGVPTSGPQDHQGWWVETKSVAVVDRPEPEILRLDVTPTIGLGGWVDVELEVRNNGGSSNDGGITLSFPDLTELGDKERVINDGSSDSLSLFSSEVGGMIYHKDGHQFPAQYVIFEGSDPNWPEGRTNVLRVRVRPSRVGQFVVQARSAMGQSGTYTGTPDSGPRDQQGWWIESRTVEVSSPPLPEILRFEVSSQVELGEWIDVSLEVRNNGGFADDGGITLSFPDLLTENPEDDIVDAGSSADLVLFWANSGDSIYHKNGTQFGANYVMFEGSDPGCEQGEVNVLKVRVRPSQVGPFRIQGRSAMGRAGLYDGMPNDGPLDQQGWWIQTHTVPVRHSPVPRIVRLDVTSEVTVGDWVDIEVEVLNEGGVANDGGVTVSFPGLQGNADKERVVDNGSSADLRPFSANPGEMIYHKDGRQIVAQYVMVEGSDPEWSSNKTNVFRIRVRPKVFGEFVVQARSAHGFDGLYTGTPQAGSIDQQGWWVERRSVSVLEAPEPEIVRFDVPARITLGDWAEIEVEVRNTGGVSSDGGVTLSFPELTDVENADDVENAGSSENFSIFVASSGDMIYRKSGVQTPASYLMFEGADPVWEKGETNILRIRVRPRTAGTFTVQARSAFGQLGTYFGQPESGPVDQQGWWVLSKHVEVDDSADGSYWTSVFWKGQERTIHIVQDGGQEDIGPRSLSSWGSLPLGVRVYPSGDLSMEEFYTLLLFAENQFIIGEGRPWSKWFLSGYWEDAEGRVDDNISSCFEGRNDYEHIQSRLAASMRFGAVYYDGWTGFGGVDNPNERRRVYRDIMIDLALETSLLMAEPQASRHVHWAKLSQQVGGAVGNPVTGLLADIGKARLAQLTRLEFVELIRQMITGVETSELLNQAAKVRKTARLSRLVNLLEGVGFPVLQYGSQVVATMLTRLQINSEGEDKLLVLRDILTELSDTGKLRDPETLCAVEDALTYVQDVEALDFEFFTEAITGRRVQTLGDYINAYEEWLLRAFDSEIGKLAAKAVKKAGTKSAGATVAVGGAVLGVVNTIVSIDGMLDSGRYISLQGTLLRDVIEWSSEKDYSMIHSPKELETIFDVMRIKQALSFNCIDTHFAVLEGKWYSVFLLDPIGGLNAIRNWLGTYDEAKAFYQDDRESIYREMNTLSSEFGLARPEVAAWFQDQVFAGGTTVGGVQIPRITVVDPPVEVRVGEVVEFRLAVSNEGDLAATSYFDVSTSPGISEVEFQPYTYLTRYEPGEPIYHSDGQFFAADHRLYSFVYPSFSTGRTLDYRLAVASEMPGDNWLRVRLSLGQDWNDPEFARYPSSGPVDQQGYHVLELPFTVLENADPEVLDANPENNSVTLSSVESQVEFSLIGVDPDGVDDELDYTWFVNGGLWSSESSFLLQHREILHGSYQVVGVVSDGEASAEHSWTLDVLSPPETISLSDYSLGVNRFPGALVAQIDTEDEDSDSFFYELIVGEGDSENGYYQVIGDRLEVRDMPEIDSDQEHSLRIRSSDQHGQFVEQIVLIYVPAIEGTPVPIDWLLPEVSLTYGQPLSEEFLAPVTVVAGSFDFSENPVGAYLEAGSVTLHAVFTPDDSATYAETSASVSMNVDRASLVVSGGEVTRRYQEPNPDFSAIFDGFVNGDGENDLGGVVEFSTDARFDSDVGLYPLVPSGVSSVNYDIEFVEGVMHVVPAAATFSISGLEQESDDSPKEVAIEVLPEGTAYIVTYNGATMLPTKPGTYEIRVLANDKNYQGFAIDVLTLTAKADVSIGDLDHRFTGEPVSASIQTMPAGLNVDVTYNGSSDLPITVGTYEVRAIIDDPVYRGFGIDVLEIVEVGLASVVIEPDSLVQPINEITGVIVTTTPIGLNVDVSYDDKMDLPTALGPHTILAVVNEAGWEGQASGTFTVTKASQSVTTFTFPSFVLSGTSLNIGLFATASSGLPVTFLTEALGASISGNTLAVTRPGTVMVNAIQVGNDVFFPAEMPFEIEIEGNPPQGPSIRIGNVSPAAVELLISGRAGAEVNIQGSSSLNEEAETLVSITLDSDGTGAVTILPQGSIGFFKAEY